MKKNIITSIIALGLTSMLTYAGEPAGASSLEGKYSIMNPDSGLIVLMDINHNGKIKISERLIAEGVKAKCKRTKEVFLNETELAFKADCKVRAGWQDIGNKQKKQVKFFLNLENLVRGIKLSEDEASVQYVGTYASEVTNSGYAVIISRLKN